MNSPQTLGHSGAATAHHRLRTGLPSRKPAKTKAALAPMRLKALRSMQRLVGGDGLEPPTLSV
jgi:hypothetical protein